MQVLSEDCYLDRKNEIPAGKQPWFVLPVFTQHKVSVFIMHNPTSNTLLVSSSLQTIAAMQANLCSILWTMLQPDYQQFPCVCSSLMAL